MRKYLHLHLHLFIFIFLLFTNLFGEDLGYVKGQIIVKYKSGISTAKIQSSDDLYSKYNISEKKLLFANNNTRTLQSLSNQSNLSNIYLLNFDEKFDSKEVAKDFEENDPNIEYAEPNYLFKLCATPNDTYFGLQWGLTKIGAPTAWDTITGSTDIIVAVIDTGVNYNHEDLSSNIIIGYDFAEDDADPMDTIGHGTHVAGIIGAKGNNSLGISGVCWNVTIMAVKVFLDYSNTTSIIYIAEGIEYAVNNGAKIINMSLGGYVASNTLELAVQYARANGVIVVAASGNDNISSVMYPAGYEGVIAVASTDENDNKSSFSNYGAWIDVSAPGSNIYSTYYDTNFSYQYGSGTSMATPMVAGLVALLLSDNPALTETNILENLQRTSDDINNSQLGAGRINVSRALGYENYTQPTNENYTQPTKLLAYPNPFDPSDVPVIIQGLKSDSIVRIFNIRGQLIKELKPSAGGTSVEWDGRNQKNNIVGSGVYVAYIKDSEDSEIIKIAVEK